MREHRVIGNFQAHHLVGLTVDVDLIFRREDGRNAESWVLTVRRLSFNLHGLSS